MTKTTEPFPKYYSLAVREDGKWAVQFGDYDRETVKAELGDYLDHGTRRKDMRIITSGDTQAEITKAVAALN